MKSKKIVITGGHLTPALALIDELQKHNWEIVYFGRKKAMQRDKQISLESKLIPEMGIKFVSIFTGRFRRHVDLENIISMCKIPVGILHSMYWLIKFRPSVVVSFGGYLGLPAIIAAWILRIPSVIHEQISVAGLANKLSAPFATKIAISFPTSAKFYPENKVVLTGNPLHSGVLKQSEKNKKKYSSTFQNKQTILVVGGNQGAKVINQSVLEDLPKLLKKYNVIHQVGSTEAQNEEWEEAQRHLGGGIQLKNTNMDSSPEVDGSSKGASNRKDRCNVNYFPIRFIPHEEMGSVYALADLVIGRSGANTISELGVLRKPAITIPIEPSLMDEQLRNAELFENSGLGKLVRQRNLNSSTLINEIESVFKNLDKFKLKQEYEHVFIKDAAQVLYKTIESML